MDSFYQFWNKIDNTELTPLSPDDMETTSSEVVEKDFEKKRLAGWNPTKLGDPMSDEEFDKYHGVK